MPAAVIPARIAVTKTPTTHEPRVRVDGALQAFAHVLRRFDIHIPAVGQTPPHQLVLAPHEMAGGIVRQMLPNRAARLHVRLSATKAGSATKIPGDSISWAKMQAISPAGASPAARRPERADDRFRSTLDTAPGPTTGPGPAGGA